MHFGINASCCNPNTINIFLILQFWAAGGGTFDSLSMTSDFSKWRGAVQCPSSQHCWHAQTLLPFSQSSFALIEQGQCFLCYVQRALDMKVLAQPFLSNDKVRFNSDVGISGWGGFWIYGRWISPRLLLSVCFAQWSQRESVDWAQILGRGTIVIPMGHWSRWESKEKVGLLDLSGVPAFSPQNPNTPLWKQDAQDVHICNPQDG